MKCMPTLYSIFVQNASPYPSLPVAIHFFNIKLTEMKTSGRRMASEPTANIIVDVTLSI